MATVVAAMFNALTRDDAPPDIVISLRRRLRIVVDKVGFTAPELMGVRWGELTSAFNTTIFGTTDESKWKRGAAPQWAVQAGRILAGEVAVMSQSDSDVALAVQATGAIEIRVTGKIAETLGTAIYGHLHGPSGVDSPVRFAIGAQVFKCLVTSYQATLGTQELRSATHGAGRMYVPQKSELRLVVQAMEIVE